MHMDGPTWHTHTHTCTDTTLTLQSWSISQIYFTFFHGSFLAQCFIPIWIKLRVLWCLSKLCLLEDKVRAVVHRRLQKSMNPWSTCFVYSGPLRGCKGTQWDLSSIWKDMLLNNCLSVCEEHHASSVYSTHPSKNGSSLVVACCSSSLNSVPFFVFS